MDDARLVRQALDGGSEAYAALADRWAPNVVALCHARLGAAAAPDAATEVFLRAADELNALSHPDRFGPWLAALVQSVCARRPARPTAEGPVAQVEALPDDCRPVLLLRLYHGSSYAALASLLDLSVHGVGEALLRSRLRLEPPGGLQDPEPECTEALRVLSARLDGEAEPRDAGCLDLHLEGCHPCRTRFADWRTRETVLRNEFGPLRDDAARCAGRVRHFLADRPRPRHRLLVVDDEPYILPTLRALLAPDYDVETASSAEDGRAAFARSVPDVVLSDQRMPGETGVQLLEWVRINHPATVRLLMTGYSELEDAVEAINRGHVYYYLLKPWRAEDLLQVVRNAADKFDLERKRERYLDQMRQLNQELERRVEERTRELREANQLLQQRTRELERLALTDPLTGLFNRRAIEELLRFELKRHARYPSPLAVGFVDVDHFKRVNTEYLLTGGDAVLCALARTLTACLREVDSVGRVGGEEFLVVARETASDGAVVLAERLRQAVEAAPVEYNHRRIPVTVSVGFAVAEAGVPAEQDALVELAAAALAEAKSAGRNCCVVRTLAGPT